MDKEDLIKKWLHNELTDVERKAFENLNDYKFNKAILEGAQHFKASNFSSVDGFEVFNIKYKSGQKPVRKLNWARAIIGAAAVLLIAFGIYFYMFQHHETTISTLAGQKTSIELPDHSKVTLNALSQIEFNEKNWNINREVSLEGEAYFMVEKGGKFDVVTADGTITVVGTAFNVKQRKNHFEVQCFEGIVRVYSNTVTQTLYAGNTFQVLNGIFIEDETTQNEPQWVNNISSFNNVPFKVVIEEFERQYDVKITIKNVNLTRQFTGGFKHGNIEEALFSITKPMDLSYEISSSNDVVIHENTH